MCCITSHSWSLKIKYTVFVTDLRTTQFGIQTEQNNTYLSGRLQKVIMEHLVVPKCCCRCLVHACLFRVQQNKKVPSCVQRARSIHACSRTPNLTHSYTLCSPEQLPMLFFRCHIPPFLQCSMRVCVCVCVCVTEASLSALAHTQAGLYIDRSIDY